MIGIKTTIQHNTLDLAGILAARQPILLDYETGKVVLIPADGDGVVVETTSETALWVVIHSDVFSVIVGEIWDNVTIIDNHEVHEAKVSYFIGNVTISC